jgi:H+/Cl- antiporter ClcA
VMTMKSTPNEKPDVLVAESETWSLFGWVARYAIVGAVCGPAVVCLFWCVLPADGFSAKIAISPILGFLIGAAGGLLGWLATQLALRFAEKTGRS